MLPEMAAMAELDVQHFSNNPCRQRSFYHHHLAYVWHYPMNQFYSKLLCQAFEFGSKRNHINVLEKKESDTYI